ncbi:MAG TPA: hypothetical protein VJR23_01905 [Candidatus Acidoferrales bacterium]|nr:hypothetical protein [Candidatus Acidoferrales bacterium]
MKLAKTITKFLGVLAVSALLLPSAWAQAAPAQPPAQQPTHKTAKRARAARKSSKKAPAPAAAPAAAPTAPAAAPTSEQAAAPGGEKSEAVANKRDPFVALISDKKESGGPEHLPPGKAGLVIASVRVDGAVQSPSGMIAVVSNPEHHVYFIREGDKLYDGDVEKIGLDGVTFKENSKDAFGHEVERMVTKRIYPTAGEQQ